MFFMNPYNTLYRPLRLVTGKANDFSDLARQCVALANAAGGVICLGLESAEGPPTQKVDPAIAARTLKRLEEHTRLVALRASIEASPSGGEYLRLEVQQGKRLCSTAQGAFFLRLGADTVPLTGPTVVRLRDERADGPWESLPTPFPFTPAHQEALGERDPDALALRSEGLLTRLGVLLLGSPAQREESGLSFDWEYNRYDESGNSLEHHRSSLGQSPLQAGEELEALLPEPLREHAHVLLLNALAHRSYASQSPVSLQWHPRQLICTNGGNLPLGVTTASLPGHCLPRNPLLVRALKALGLMEARGQGTLELYDLALSHACPLPQFLESNGSLSVIVSTEPVDLALEEMLEDQESLCALEREERLLLGLVAIGGPQEPLALAEALPCMPSLEPWLEQLLERELLVKQGKGARLRYALHPRCIPAKEKGPAPRRIEPLHLRSLVLAYVEDHASCTDTECGRFCKEKEPGCRITARLVKHALNTLAAEGLIAIDKTRNQWRYGPIATHS